MDDTTQPDRVQEVVTKAFADLGATGPVIRTILLKDGYFVGNKFQCDGRWALLAAGEGSIEFHDQDGGPLRTINLDAAEGQRAA
jgi:hypothetical protein